MNSFSPCYVWIPQFVFVFFGHILSIKNTQVIKLILPVMVSPCYTTEILTEGGKFLFIYTRNFCSLMEIVSLWNFLNC